MELSYMVRLAVPLRERISLLAGASHDGRETGGILLGHGPNPAGLIEVAHVGDPGPDAERRSDFFLRDLQHSRRLAAQAWLADGSDWIGEWHTHPTGGPRPSPRDLRTYSQILTVTPALEVFLSLILTPARDGCWSAPRTSQWLIRAAVAEGESIRVEAARPDRGR
jgi:integrative and conjugative element protein (TIGR02256 family)